MAGTMVRQLPNLITMFRVISAPIVAILLWQPQTPSLTAFIVSLFILAAISDFFDGWLARKLQVVSAFGRMLDPIADKLLVAGCIIALAATRDDGGWFLLPALMIMMREFLVAGLREFLADTKLVVPVTLMAKWKTAIQLISIAIIICAPVAPNPPLIDMTGLALFWLSAFMTVKTGFDYFKAATPYLKA
jgi:cardiolipin synthase